MLTVLPYYFRSSWAQSQSIADVAISAPDILKLVQVTVALDVVFLIGNCAIDPFTGFAPTYAAFKYCGKDLSNDIIADTTSDAALDIFSFHVVLGNQLSSDFTDRLELRTLNEKSIQITSHDEGTVLKVNPAINGRGATILTTDIEACDGIKHIIDAVLGFYGEFKPEGVDDDSKWKTVKEKTATQKV